ncbi:MAG: methyltransferase domain-containing protein [Ardenticatenaceae bacterium]|nr:methyltransferase domain-containing protein [Ardenticatenaceae bacterium]
MIDVQCNLCGADNYVVRFPATMQPDEQIEVDVFSCTNPGYGHHAQIVQCRECGYVYANPRWSGDEILQAYTAVTDETYVQERAGRELTFQKHLRSLEKRVGQANGRSLLDVGAYIGVFVETAARAGWQACGVEPSEWAASVAQRQGLNVIHGTQDAPELAGKQFDVITMWDVIEHVANPSGEIGKAYQLLEPGGWLVVHTMDISSLTAKLMGSRWPWLMDMHIHYFSQKTLRQMLKKNGFEIVWSGAEGRYLRLNYLVSRVEALSRPLGRLAGWLVNGLRLGGVAIPINFGDLFTVYARRPY